MIATLIGLAIVALSAYMWLTRGFFSAFIHLVCTIIAGAIAFALWEPIAYAILGSQTTAYGMVSSMAWGVSLLLPFLASLAILRLAVDNILKWNVKVPQAVNYIGGGLCGALAGVIVAGILILSVGFLRVEREFMGAPVSLEWSQTGGLEAKGNSAFVDKFTVKFYSFLSLGAFSTDTAMADLAPGLYTLPTAMRMTDGEGKNSNAVKESEVVIKHRYSLDVKGKTKLDEIMSDKWRDAANLGPQRASDLSGNPFPVTSRIEGFVVELGSGAVEKFGQIVISNPQVWLVCSTPDGTSQRLHPIAVASAAQAVGTGGRTRFGRFHFDSKAGLHLASVGGSTSNPMAFEFLVPQGWEPRFVSVRNIRVDISGLKPIQFGSVAERDESIESGTIFTGGQSVGGTIDIASLDASLKITIGNGRPLQPGQSNQPDGVIISNTLGFTIQKGTHGGLDLTDDNAIRGGRQNFSPESFQQSGLIDRKLRVERFATSEDAGIIQLNVSSTQQVNLLLRSVTNVETGEDRPMLVDSQGRTYPAVGYVYEARDLVTVRFTPGSPIRSIANDIDTPLSLSRSDQKMKLVFRVSVGAEIRYFVVGKTIVAEYSPGFMLAGAQR